MSTFDKKIEALEKRRAEIAATEEKLRRETEKIDEEIVRLGKEKVEASDKLTPQEEKDLRKRLTVLGGLLTKERVLFAYLRLKSEEPDTDVASGYCGIEITGKYSISIETYLIEEYGGPGFRINATIKTKVPHVEAIVREMFDDNYKEPGMPAFRTLWNTDWDYGNRIILRNPVSPDDDSNKETSWVDGKL